MNIAVTSLTVNKFPCKWYFKGHNWKKQGTDRNRRAIDWSQTNPVQLQPLPALAPADAISHSVCSVCTKDLSKPTMTQTRSPRGSWFRRLLPRQEHESLNAQIKNPNKCYGAEGDGTRWQGTAEGRMGRGGSVPQGIFAYVWVRCP